MTKEKILIIDLEVDVLDLCKRILETQGYDVKITNSGHQAIDLTRQETFDLLLTNAKTQDMTGLEIVQSLKQTNSGIICIMMTGFATLDTAIQARSVGVDELILKPFTPKELNVTVSKALEKKHLKQEISRLRSLIPIFELNKILMGKLEEEDILNLLLDIAQTETEAHFAIIFITENNKITAHYEKKGNNIRGSEQEASKKLAKFILKGNDQLTLNLNKIDQSHETLIKQLGATSAIATPLKSQKSNLGVLILTRKEGFFKPTDSEFLHIFCGQVAIALEHARSYNQITLETTNSEFINKRIGEITDTDIPYTAGPPISTPEMFFGRQSDFKKIIGMLTSNFVMVIGPRRIGKTSLLHQLVHHLPRLIGAPEKSVPVLVSLEGVPETEFFHTIMEEVVNDVQECLSTEIVNRLSFDLSDTSYSSRSFSRDLQIILKILQTTTPKPSRLILLLDEMDTLNNYSLEIQSQLRRIFQRFINHNLSVVVAGVRLHRHWAGESSPFYNMFVPVELTPFSKAEARRLVTEPVKGIYTYSEKAIDRIIETTSALPHRIQQLCLEIIYYLQATAKRRTEITQSDVDTVLQTIHWLDEEIDTQDQFERPTVAVSPPAIAEQKARYDTLFKPIETYQKTYRDDLTVIRGIGPVYQQKLRYIGFSTFEQLSRANPDQLRRLLDIRDWQRINIESWIEQARYWAQKDQ